ncbi:MAG: hypothetical protein NZ895_04495 [Archaeoglobaceae archaeon]|nr:hypothetical protein [Archaeoglobaceae archaeon]MCX8152600.1 hypothetical protein [Archaeoglobaceae archaeon]MDW8014118.1 hypothetical protein [Archaeoglobaceae archaeon]
MKLKDSFDLLEHFGNLIDDETREILKKYLKGERELKDAKGKIERVYENSETKTLLLDSKIKVVLLGEAAKIEVFEGLDVSVRGFLSEGKIEVKNVKDLEITANFTPISQLVSGKRSNLRGRVSGLGDVDFAREIYLSDKTGRIKVLLMEKKVYDVVDIGDCVEIFNCLIKVNKKGELEAHVDKKSKVRFCE